jgi:ABC-type polysaccharide/polyol phosphate export permease
MNELRAVTAACWQEWKTTATSFASLVFLLEAVPMVVVFAWIANQSDDPSVLAYIVVGAPLMAIWNGVLFRVGRSLNNELFGRTLEFAMISRTPVMVVLLGKAVAQIAYGILTGVVTLLVMFLVARQLPEVANLPLLLVSLAFVIVGLTMASLVVAPIMVLVGGRAGFYNAIMPFGVVLSAFLFPVDRLPVVLEVMARFLPMSWAMESVWQSIRGPESLWSVVFGWALCIVTSAGLFGATYLMFKAVERRIRVTGVLSAY